MAKPGPAKATRERLEEDERQRAHRIASWSMARNEGIREGLLMAIAAIKAANPSNAVIALPPHETVIARGNRHFGDEEWQTEPRRR